MSVENQMILPDGEIVYCLRTVDQNGQAYQGFRWPKTGYVEAPDWSTEPQCGHGLHGYLRGAGDAESIQWDGLFQVIKVIEEELIDLIGKVKFPRCEVVLTGTQKEATDFLVKEYPGVPVIGATVVVGDCGTASAGHHGTATAGNYGTATAGHYGKATAGNRGTATAGHYGTATAGDGGTATAGNFGTATAGGSGTATAGGSGTATAGDGGKAMAGHDGTATAGNDGTATAGDRGTAMAGYNGTAMAGYNGTATAGNFGTATAGGSGTATAGGSGTATAGDGGKAMAGEKGRISLTCWDTSRSRSREVIGYIGEDGLLANVSYRLNNNHKFVKA